MVSCWDTHKQVGMKMKNGRRVPNCVQKLYMNEDAVNAVGGGNIAGLGIEDAQGTWHARKEVVSLES